MLMNEEKTKNQEKYFELLEKIGLNTSEFREYLNSIGYFEAPATTTYHGNYAGGLCEYALRLAHELGVLCNAYFPGKYTEEDVLKVALLKDLYRSIMYESYSKNVKNETTGQWEAVLAYRTKEERPVYGDLGFSSYMSLRKFINFSDEQIEAIIHSTGLNNYAIDIHDILKEYPLVTLTRMASEVVTYLQ